jgi:hypothetical protein
MRIENVRIRRRLLGVLMSIAIHPSTAMAQSAILSVTGGPALVRTLSHRDSAWQAGFGAERVNGSKAFGADIDYVYFPPNTYALGGGHGTGTEPSLNMAAATLKGIYHFGEDGGGSRVRPFVAGGLSLLFQGPEGEFGMILLSGGFDWWTSHRTGIRVELRGQFPIMLGVRAGIVFR